MKYKRSNGSAYSNDFSELTKLKRYVWLDLVSSLLILCFYGVEEHGSQRIIFDLPLLLGK